MNCLLCLFVKIFSIGSSTREGNELTLAGCCKGNIFLLQFPPQNCLWHGNSINSFSSSKDFNRSNPVVLVAGGMKYFAYWKIWGTISKYPLKSCRNIFNLFTGRIFPNFWKNPTLHSGLDSFHDHQFQKHCLEVKGNWNKN